MKWLTDWLDAEEMSSLSLLWITNPISSVTACQSWTECWCSLGAEGGGHCTRGPRWRNWKVDKERLISRQHSNKIKTIKPKTPLPVWPRWGRWWKQLQGSWRMNLPTAVKFPRAHILSFNRKESQVHSFFWVFLPRRAEDNNQRGAPPHDLLSCAEKPRKVSRPLLFCSLYSHKLSCNHAATNLHPSLESFEYSQNLLSFEASGNVVFFLFLFFCFLFLLLSYFSSH